MFYLNINDRFLLKPKQTNATLDKMLKWMLPSLVNHVDSDGSPINTELLKGAFEQVAILPTITVKPISIQVTDNPKWFRYLTKYGLLIYTNKNWEVTIHIQFKKMIVSYNGAITSVHKLNIDLDSQTIIDVLTELMKDIAEQKEQAQKVETPIAPKVAEVVAPTTQDVIPNVTLSNPLDQYADNFDEGDDMLMKEMAK